MNQSLSVPNTYPLTAAQRDIWLDQAVNSDIPLYNLVGYAPIKGNIDGERLQRAATKLIRRHDALRMVLLHGTGDDGLPVQAFVDHPSLQMTLHDFSGHEDPDTAIREFVKARAQVPFKMDGSPLIRMQLLRVSENLSCFCLEAHHLIIDGWGISLLLTDLAELYEADDASDDSQAPSYVQFIQDDIAYRDSKRYARDQDYWLNKYQDVPEPLLEPRHRSGTGLAPSGQVSRSYPPALLERIDQVAQPLQCSRFQVLMAALYVYFIRTSRREEVVLGLPILNRSNANFRKTMGLFTQVSAVRLRFDAELSFAELAAEIAGVLKQDYRNQRFPLSEMNRSLGLLRDGRGQVFDVSVSYELTDQRLTFDGAPSYIVKCNSGYEQTPLAIYIRSNAHTDEFFMDFIYNEAFFQADEVESLAERFMHILEQGLQDPNLQVRAFNLPTPAEARLLEAWNQNHEQLAAQDYQTIHGQFEAQAQARPDAMALLHEGQRVTYGQLNAQANQVAHRLRQLGAGPDNRVGICVDRGPLMIIGLLGILKAGAGYVPLDPAYPQERLAFMLDDSMPLALLTESAHLEHLPAQDIPLLLLDQPEAAGIAGQPQENPQVAGLETDHLAYVIYTSGSTGLPKGVMVEHRNVLRLFSATREWFDFGTDDVWALFHSFAFDFSVWEIWGALLHGGSLLLVPQLTTRSPEACYDLLCEAGVTVLNQTPSAFRQIIAAQGENPRPHALRQVIFGGEALDTSILKPWYARQANADTQLFNMYGITETTVHVTCYPLSKDDVEGGVSPIGKRIQDLRLYLLDANGQPVPPGVVAELYVGGAGVARGYLNRPELNTERFLADPFDGSANARMYRSGDLARWTRDGNLDYLGRNDDQVKVRGFRIELGEIESRLAACAGVREAVVIARQDEPGDKRLVGYVIPEAGQSPTAADLRSELLENLADYMVPTAFVLLSEFPLTTNGKLDRKALPVPDAAAFARREYEAPQGPVETLLAGLWSELLGVERISRHDQFFELGGDSLRAVKLIERMREVGLHVDVRVLFGQPTLRVLAATAGSGREVAVPTNLIEPGVQRITPQMLPLARLSQEQIDAVVGGVPGGVANVQDIYALVPLQEGILYHYLSTPEGDPYLLQGTLRMDSRAHVDSFVQALQAVVARHDILRTSIAWEGLDEPVQVVWREAPLRVHEHALHVTDGDIAAQLQDLLDPRHMRFDLRQAPLLELHLAEDAARGGWVAVILLHHLIDDATSLRILGMEIQAHIDGRSAELAASVPYRNYVAQSRLGISREEHEAFFSSALGDVNEPTLPFGLQDVQGDGIAIEQAVVALDDQLAQRLRAHARELGVSNASIHHLAWGQVVGRLSGRDDVVFGTVLMGRMQGGQDADRALGMFINTLPLRVPAQGPSVRAAIRTTHERLAALLGHEHAPLALAQRCSGVAAPTPLFSALLNYRHAAVGASAGEATTVLKWAGFELSGGEERTNFPLSLSVDDLGEAFSLTVQVVPGIGARRIADYMHAVLGDLADALDRDSEVELQSLAYMPDAERQQLLHGFNACDEAYARDLLVHQLFEARAEQQPDALAVTFESQRVSYGELNRQANRIAHRLMELGVGFDDRVAICCRRSPEMIAGLWGILKAGAGYVPLDPDYPAERLEYMLSDSAPKAVLSQASVAELFKDSAVPGVLLDGLAEGAEEFTRQPDHNPELAVQGLGPQHLAYVIYTSGSTGQPKGVAMPHAPLVNLMQWQLAEGIRSGNPAPATVQFAALGFDVAFQEIFSTLCAGAPLSLIHADTRLDLRKLYLHLCEARIERLYLPCIALQALAEALTDYPALREQTCALREVVTAGEQLRITAPIRALFEHLSECRLHNHYGPTESHVTTSHTLPVNVADWPTLPAIGVPVANTRIYLLDAQFQPVPVGVAGEIYIGGTCVARGYLNRDDLTAERFLADPFVEAGSGRLYKTGDLGCRNADGVIEYLGRNDDQIKIRGFRVELGEIESRLTDHLSVRDAAVVAREDNPGDKRLVAYFTQQPGQEPASVDVLRAHLQACLPDYMVPAAYVELEKMPVSANGKLDRRSLPAPDASAFVSQAYEAPRGNIETTLASLWSQILGVAQVGRHDHFFELGGHSLLAVKLIERMRQLDMDADVRVLFSQPTLSALAAAVGGVEEALQIPDNGIPEACEHITASMLTLLDLEQNEVDRIVAAMPGGTANIQDIYPLAPLQEGILYHHISAEQGDPYLLQAAFAMDSRAQLDSFIAALQTVIDRHDILRTALIWDGLEQPLQVVLRQARLIVETLELDASAGDIASQVQALFDPRDLRLDLGQAPLMRMACAHDETNQRWVAILLFHHIALDHTALEVMQHEMQLILSGESVELEMPMPYRCYVAQARMAVSQAAHEDFFREMLGDVEEPTLPLGLQEVQGDGRGVEESRFRLDPVLSARLRGLSRKLGVSPASLHHLAWAQVVGNLSGRSDVVFGTVLLGRMQAGSGAERALGMFINTLPVRVALGAVSVSQGVRQTHTRLTALLGHEHASLALAQRCSGVPASMPLFSALLNYRHSPILSDEEVERWGGAEVLEVMERTNYPFMLSVDDLGEGFLLTVQTVAAIASQRVAGYMNTALESLADALESSPDLPLHALKILPAQEHDEVISGFNATQASYPLDQTVHGLFEAQVERTPDAVALVFGDERLSYGELNQRANRLAHHLRSQGVVPDARVAICVERGIDMVVGLLAILKAGSGYVPLDPAYPAERIAYMLEDSAPAAVLAQSATLDLVSAAGVPVINLDQPDWQDKSVSNPVIEGLTPAHLAYVIYTSGSTGLPKGVMIEHRNTVNFLTWAQQAFEPEVLSKTLFSTSLNFDLAVYECFAPLISGGSIEVVKNVLALQEGEHDITLINTVPSALKALLESGGLQEGVHTVNVAGEALKGSLVESLFEQTSVQRLCNLYGPSETTTYSSWVSMDREDGFAAHIGKPVANTQFYLLDEHRQPVPLGVPGEIYIGGAGVARGYLNRDDLTAERFLEDPFNVGARMYRTGDLGRWLADGNIEYLGRNDDQVKIRGFRIELGEIEAKLARHESVKEAVVMAREDVPGDKRLVAYFTSNVAEVDLETLKAHLQGQLPEYMVPAAYVHLEKLPLTPNGKLDRKALPVPDLQALISRGYEAPQGNVEKALAQIWAEVLQVERVGRHDHFFELGGHSLLAVKLIEKMRQQGLSADVRVLFSQPTLMALAAAVGNGTEIRVPANLIEPGCTHITPDMLPLVTISAEQLEQVIASIPGGAANIQDIYPLAPLQEGILYHHLAAKQGDPYVLQAAFEFADKDRLDAFSRALQSVIDRHDILRTSLYWEGLDEPVQVVWRQATLGMEHLELDLEQGDIASQLQARFDTRQHRMDIRQAPLMQIAYAQDSATQRWVALLLFHHMALDHTALEVVQHEMEAWLLGDTGHLSEPVPYRNYVAQVRLSNDSEAQEAFFRDMLGDLDEPTLPFGLHEVQGEGRGIEEHRLTLDLPLSKRLRALARQLGVSVASLHHLAWGQVLSAASGRDDVVFGTVLVGRLNGGEGADRALGMFINTLPLRLQLGAGEVKAGVRETHARLSALLAHEHAPLALAQRCSGVPASTPLFSALLNYRYSAAPGEYSLSPAWEGIEPLKSEERTNYPLTLSVDDQGEGFELTVLVQDGIGAARVASYMNTALTELADALENTPTAPLYSVSVLPAEELTQLLHGYNDTVAEYPLEQTVHGLFEAQVERTPDTIALVFGAERLSYGELNQRANRLAHHLRSQGVVPDSRVAICVERGIEMVVGLLAILKAGGGYVPLDPAYPAERIAYMLEDSSPAAVLAQSATLDLVSAAGVTVINLDQPDWQDQSVSNPVIEGLTPAHLAYVIYTSGSTGLPKGVMIEHRNTVNFLTWAQQAFESEVLAKTLFSTSLNFDLAVYECFAPLISGGSIEVVKNVLALQEGEHDVTLINTVPSALKALLESGGLGQGVHTVNVAGEALKGSLVESLFEQTSVQRLCNLYGPSETTTYSSWVAMDREDGFAAHIGKPVANTQFYLLDEHRQPVPLGVPGEIYIGGAGVARGYLNRDDLTAERFLEDPFNAGARMYRTGDLGRWLSDGNIEYLGRNDDQVKIRGFRIELGEIEAKLARHESVKEAVVMAREDVPGDKRLVAYFTSAGVEVDPETLKAHLQGQLPEYMVPAAYVHLDKLPLTPNGKLDRKALPAPDLQSLISRGYEAPVGETEITLAQIWADVLQVERVGRHDHFFELGGHSLLAVKLIEKMRQQGLSADVRVLFSQPTLMALAAAVGSGTEIRVPANLIEPGCTHITPDMLPLLEISAEQLEQVIASIPGGSANIQDIYPLAPLQEGILYHHLAAEQGDPYVLQAVFGFANEERLNAFTGALQSVIDRHDILRTSLCWEGLDEPVQVVWRQAQLKVEQVEVDASLDVVSQLQDRFDARQHRMDIRQAPLMRIAYAQDPANQRWVAFLLFHHLALDHTALEVVQHEMEAWLLDNSQPLSEPVPYRNYVAQARLGTDREAQEVFFRDMLGDLEEPTLPFGLHEVQGEGRDIEEHRLPLDLDLSKRLRAQARQLGVSVASLHHLAWAQVVSAASGRDDVVFGTVLMGRLSGGEGADRALGMFINTLPLRLQLNALEARTGVRETHARLSALLAHEHAPLALAQRCSGVPASTPLFSALLNYRYSAAPGDYSLSPAWAGIEALKGDERTNYPLTLSVDDHGEGFELIAQVQSSVGAERVSAYMHTALIGLVEALEQHPQASLGSLSVLPQDELEQLLHGFNATEAEYPLDQTVHGLFEAQAERTPDAVALVFGDERLSYGELNQRANQLAHHLRSQGVVPDARVAICVERGVEMVVGLLAILKAGGGYVPLDPAYPAERIAYMLEDSAPAAVLAQSATLDLVSAAGVTVINLDQPDWQDQSVSNPVIEGLTPAHLAYVIYTSGSTGLPKGVMIEHRNTVNFLTWAQQAFAPEVLAKTLFSTSLNFDLAVYECFAPLISGGRIDVVKNVLALQEGEHDITLINTVPSALKALLESGGLGQGVHTVNVAGEALKGSLVESLFEQTSVQRLCNLYGPSETTTYSSWVSMDREDGFAAHIGKPVANTQFYLLDEHRQPVPLGVPGEIYIGGAGVARGYLNRDDLTAERFLEDPFNAGARMYRTGDLGRWLADGNIEYLGRNDDQVKIRGFRIELGEIETKLARHESVKEAVVMAREDVPGDKRLVAYFTSSVAEINLETLKAHLQGQLPEYMVPAAYVHLDKLPLTPNGKLDRKALPAPDLQALISRGYEAPKGETENTLAQIWAEVLQVERVGRHDHFFELGGHSLLAVKLIEKMRQQGLSADVRVLFSQPTLMALAAAVGNGTEIRVPVNLIEPGCTHITPDMLPLATISAEQLEQVIASIPGGAANIQDIYPLAPLQEGILYHYLVTEDDDPYAVQTLFGFASEERLKAFSGALQSVIERHDILRTSFFWEGLDEPVQVVWRQARLEVEALELDPAQGDIGTQLEARFDARQYRMDIRHAPLLRIVYAHDPVNQRWVGLLLSHHLILDNTALAVVTQEMEACLLNTTQHLNESVPYRNYVAQSRLGVDQAAHEAFFRSVLGDLDEPTLPFGLHEVQGDGYSVEEHHLALDRDLSLRLRAQARQLGVSVASLHHLAWAQVLSAASGRDDVVFGTVLMGRLSGGEGADRALGMFINTLPLRLQLNALEARTGVRETHARLSALLAHEHAPLALAQRCSAVPASTPLFSALLNYRYSAATDEHNPSLAWEGIEPLKGSERTNYPLTLSVNDQGEGFELTVLVQEGIGAARVAAYMSAALAGLVTALEHTPSAPLHEISVLPAEELAQLLHGYNDTVAEYPLDQTVHGLFEAQVERTPDAVALVFGDERLSYGELNQRANRLAHHLRSQGVVPDSRVAICVERGIEMVVG
ncbi:amino acid adenylation domain-containing protein, partial [Pseudomonas cichorii]|nr:amino acid adenylation domain-containing protein [Pseudomonas cichorii]